MFDLPNPSDDTPHPDLLGALLHTWSPIVGGDLRPLGVRVQVRRHRAATQGTAPLAAVLDSVMAGFAHDGGVSFPHGLVVLAPQDMALDASMLTWHAPRNVVLELPASVLQDEDSLRFVFDVHRCGARFALRLKDGEAVPSSCRLSVFQYVVTDAHRLVDGTLTLPLGDALLLAIDGENETDAHRALKAKAHGVAGWALVHTQPSTEHALAPMQQSVLDLIRLAQSDAEVQALEAAFKNEPVLAYMLLTLANSPAFVRTTPIASLRHAITLLGYRRLVKWLILLMVVANKNARARPQIYGAVARGFFMENLAAAQRASPTTQDECFVVGAFSLLGAITGQSLSSLLQQVSLPQTVVDALLHQEGTLGTFLRLALAVEDVGTASSDRALNAACDAHLELDAVNRALLQALSATDALQSAL